MRSYIAQFTPIGVPTTVQRYIYFTAIDDAAARQIASDRFFELHLSGRHVVTVTRGFEFNVEGPP